jgi:hypothetical protein
VENFDGVTAMQTLADKALRDEQTHGNLIPINRDGKNC